MPLCPSDSEDEDTTPSSTSNRSFFNICGYGTNSSTTSEVASIESEDSRKSVSPALVDNTYVNRLRHCEKHGPYVAEDDVRCCRGCLKEQQSMLSLPDELKVEKFLDVLEADQESNVSPRLSITDVTLQDHVRRKNSTQEGLHATVERLKQIQIERRRSGEDDGDDLSTTPSTQGACMMPTTTRMPGQNTQIGVIRHQGRRFKIVPASTDSMSDLASSTENTDQKDVKTERMKAEHNKRLLPSKPPAIDIISPSPTLSLMSDCFAKPTLAPIGFGFGYLSPKSITPISLSSCSSSLGTSGTLSPISTSSKSEDGASPLPPLVRTPKLRRRDLLPPIHPRDWGMCKLSSPSSDSDKSSRYPFSSRTPSDYGSDSYVMTRTPEGGSGGSSHSPKSETEMNVQQFTSDAAKQSRRMPCKEASPLSGDNKHHLGSEDHNQSFRKQSSGETLHYSNTHPYATYPYSDGESRKTTSFQPQQSSPMPIPASSVNFPARRISLNVPPKLTKIEPMSRFQARRDSKTHTTSRYTLENSPRACQDESVRNKYSSSTVSELSCSSGPNRNFSTGPISIANAIRRRDSFISSTPRQTGLPPKNSMKNSPVGSPSGTERDCLQKNSLQVSPRRISTVQNPVSSPTYNDDLNSPLSISPKVINDWKDSVAKFTLPRKRISAAKINALHDQKTLSERTSERYHFERDDKTTQIVTNKSLSAASSLAKENSESNWSEASKQGLGRKNTNRHSDVLLPSITSSDVGDKAPSLASAWNRDQHESVPSHLTKQGAKDNSKSSQKLKGPKRRITIDSPSDYASMRRKMGLLGKKE